MTSPIFVPMPGNERLASRLAHELGAEATGLELRHFPDGETYLRYPVAVEGRSLALVCTLDRPDAKFLPLVFAAATARELGAKRVGLVCPYLAYMRQDRRFQTGEAVTSTHYARLLSGEFDWLLTVDPHLHRRGSLDEIYSIPTSVVHAAPLISGWIKREVPRPLIVGPDSESEQWVASVARDAEAPYVILGKVRRGDWEVQVSVPDLGPWPDHTPVLVDDIVSTGRTMIECIGRLLEAGSRAPICAIVHGLFAGDSYRELVVAGARVVTSSTVPHDSNAIDVVPLLTGAAKRLLA